MNTPFPVRKDGKFSVEEFFALIESRPEEERWQLIDGVAMMMPPPTLVHQLEDLDSVIDIPEWSFRIQLGDLYRGTPLGRPVQ